MIAVASFRPLDKSVEVAINQLRAKQSWEQVFDAIVYFGVRDARLDSPRTSFIPYHDFPTISLMAYTASISDDWACLLNSDIVVSPMLPAVWDEAVEQDKALSSFRWEYVGDDLVNARVVDNGFDFFCATPALWRKVSKEVPEAYRIGHNCFDSWLLGFFHTECRDKFYDITARRCVFHPRHGDRKQKFDIGHQPSNYQTLVGSPTTKML